MSREISDPSGTVLDAKNLARLAPRHAGVEERGVKELSALAPPPALNAQWLKILAYRRTLANELVKLGSAAKAADSAAIEQLSARKKRLYKELSAVAAPIGLGACARAGAVSGPPPIGSVPGSPSAGRS